MDSVTLYDLGALMVFVGIAISIVAIVLLLFRGSDQKRKVKGGGAIIIGFIPIIFGTDKESVKKILVLSILLVIAIAVATILYRLTLR
jgi:uncharacterized protein (TIGR00304 family)